MISTDKKFRYWPVILLNIVFLALIGTAFLYFSSSFFERENYRTQNIIVPILKDEIYSGDVATSTPVKISIPAVGIDGKVVSVGITQKGNMAVPEKYEDVGWYRFGASPGQKGNAVLAGHLDNGKGEPAVFYNLSNLKIGDDVFVESDGGEKLQFIVREIRLVDYNSPPLEEIFGRSDKERLNLITCDGTWIPELKMYSERLVVFTERVK
jgi:sortase A